MAGNGKLPLHARFLALHVISPIRKARECVSEKHTYFYIVYSFFCFYFIYFIQNILRLPILSIWLTTDDSTPLRVHTWICRPIWNERGRARAKQPSGAHGMCRKRRKGGARSKIVSCQTPSFSSHPLPTDRERARSSRARVVATRACSRRRAKRARRAQKTWDARASVSR